MESEIPLPILALKVYFQTNGYEILNVAEGGIRISYENKYWACIFYNKEELTYNLFYHKFKLADPLAFVRIEKVFVDNIMLLETEIEHDLTDHPGHY